MENWNDKVVLHEQIFREVMEPRPHIFRIEYDNPEGVFYPGNMVTGRVRLHIDFPIVRFSGKHLIEIEIFSNFLSLDCFKEFVLA